MKKICIITGPPGAGKTTITKELAKSVKKGAAIDVDEIRHMIKAGYAKPWIKGNKAKEQKELAIKNACALTKNFLKFGANVFIDDVLVKKNSVRLYKKLLGNKAKFFLLLPSKDILVKRVSLRDGKEHFLVKRTAKLYDIFCSIKDNFEWHIIDNSSLAVKKIVKKILEEL